MVRFITTLTLLFCVGAPGALLAQGADAPEPLALHTLIDDALARSAPLRASKAQADAANASLDAARSTVFPRVSFTESWQRGNQPIFVFSTLLASRRFAASNFAIDQLNHPDSLGAFHATAAIEHVLFDGGARKASIAQASAQAEIATLATSDAELTTVARIVEMYGRLLAVQANRAAVSGALDSAREDLQLAERRRDAGTVTEADVLSLAVRVADLRQRIIQLDGDAAIVRAQLNRLAGAPLAREFRAVAPEAADLAAAPSLADAMADADAHRPDVKLAAASVSAAEEAGRAARAALLPRVAAQGAVDIAGTRAFDRASSWIVGGEVRWSLGLGGTERAQIGAATAAASRARAEADDVKAQVHVEVLTALRQLETARARQAVGDAMVAQARESHRITRDRYEAGLARVNDVLLASATLLDAEAQRASAVADEFTSRAHLSRATGHRP
ncbi:MAG: TolC family protein [Vicinamibacterales bacterium]